MKKVVEADVSCDVCGQYFLPTLPTQAVEVKRRSTYRCSLSFSRVKAFT